MSQIGKFYSESDLAKIFSVEGRTIRNWISTIGFPKPLILGGKTTRWKEGDVIEWVEKQEKK